MYCVPEISLSIVPGIPITGKLNSFWNILAPLKEPSPPITTRDSILFFVKLLYAFFLPEEVLKSVDLADFRIVPPLFIILLTLLAFALSIKFSIKP